MSDESSDITDREAMQDLFNEIEALRAQNERISAHLRKTRAPVPPTRRYTMTEAGIRLVAGTDPARLTSEERDQVNAISRSTIYKLCTDGDCVLTSEKVGGTRFVTERSIQVLERGIAEDYVEGYQIIDRIKYRRLQHK